MLNITHYQRNANQNYNEIPPHTDQNGHHQRPTNSLHDKTILMLCQIETKLPNFLCRKILSLIKNVKFIAKKNVSIQLLTKIRIRVSENSRAERTFQNHVVQGWQMDSIIHQFQLIGGGCLECFVENSEALSIFNRKENCDRLVMSAMSAVLLQLL